jgi:hypothetical protein
MVLVKADIQNKNASELCDYSEQVEAAMATNPKFPDPVPSLTEVAAARVLLNSAIAPAANGDRVAVALRNTRWYILANMLVRLCGYVNSASNGDRDVALTSAFVAAKKPTKLGLIGNPTDLVAKATEKRSEAALYWKSRHGSKMSQIFINSGDPNNEDGWELKMVTTRNRALITGLDPNKIYWFRVNTVCSAGITGFSDPAWVRAAA